MGGSKGRPGPFAESLFEWCASKGEWVEVGADPLGRFFPAIPERWAVRAGHDKLGLLVGLSLFRTALAVRSSVVKLSDRSLAVLGIDRFQLYRTLNRLEELGLIRCSRRNGAKTEVEILALEGEEDRTAWCLGQRLSRRGLKT